MLWSLSFRTAYESCYTGGFGRWALSGGWEFRMVLCITFSDDLKKVMVIEFSKEYIDLTWI